MFTEDKEKLKIEGGNYYPANTDYKKEWWQQQGEEPAAIGVRGRERSRVLCFYGVSDVAACWNPRGMVPVR